MVTRGRFTVGGGYTAVSQVCSRRFHCRRWLAPQSLKFSCVRFTVQNGRWSCSRPVCSRLRMGTTPHVTGYSQDEPLRSRTGTNRARPCIRESNRLKPAVTTEPGAKSGGADAALSTSS
eukprot:2641199-Prymnesium_polylepis.1